MGKFNLSIKLKNRFSDLEKIKTAVSKMFSSVECSKRNFQEVNLILEELFTNIVKHGFKDSNEHDIDITLSCDKKCLMIRMTDDGNPFDLTSAALTDTKCSLEKRFIGGLGVNFVKHFIDDCKYERKEDKNIISLKKYLENDDNITNE